MAAKIRGAGYKGKNREKRQGGCRAARILCDVSRNFLSFPRLFYTSTGLLSFCRDGFIFSALNINPMAIKKLRLFLLVIVLPAFVFTLAAGIHNCQHTAVAQNAGADISAVATCTGSMNCKACKNCSSCKHCKQDKGSCGVCK